MRSMSFDISAQPSVIDATSIYVLIPRCIVGIRPTIGILAEEKHVASALERSGSVVALGSEWHSVPAVHQHERIGSGLDHRDHPREHSGLERRRPAGRDRHASPTPEPRRCRRLSATIAAVPLQRSASRAPTISRSSCPGFKSYERKGVALSPNDTRGIDVRLDVGQQTETVTVTAQQEVIQTETGAREGVLTAKQIDNLSVIGRSALELLRILPGVVTDFNQGESVSFGGGANNTQGYTVNGIRSSSNTVVARRLVADRHRQQQRRHRLPEQRHGSGSEGPELELRGRVRHRRHERERRHQVRHARSSTARPTTTCATASSRPTIAPTASPARRSRRASISIPAATSAARSPSATTTRRTATSCSSSSRSKAQRQQVDSGSRFARTYTPGDAQRRLQRAAGATAART